MHRDRPMRKLPRTGAEAWIIVKITDKVKPFAGMVSLFGAAERDG